MLDGQRRRLAAPHIRRTGTSVAAAIGANAISWAFSARPARVSGPLRRAIYWPPRVALLKEAVFDLAVDPMEPLLGTIGSLLASGEFSLQFGNAIFGSPQLIRKLLSHAKRVTTVFVSYAGSLCDQLQDGLACLVDLIAWPGRLITDWPYRKSRKQPQSRK